MITTTPLPYYGSKRSMAQRIVAELPEHSTYVEPFCGAAAVFFRKPRVDRELLTDANGWAVAALRAVRDSPDDLLGALPRELGHDDWRSSVIAVRNDERTGDDVTDAVTMIAAWQSAFNSSPWSGARSQRMCDQYANTWRKGTFEARVRAGHERLRGVAIEQADALCVIPQHVAAGTLFFLDPPYMRMEHGGGSRGAAYNGYGPHDPDRDFHEALTKMLVAYRDRAAFVITSGMDELYQTRLGEAGYGFLGGFGLEGRGPGRGGTGTAKHLIWANHARRLL